MSVIELTMFSLAERAEKIKGHFSQSLESFVPLESSVWYVYRRCIQTDVAMFEQESPIEQRAVPAYKENRLFIVSCGSPLKRYSAS